MRTLGDRFDAEIALGQHEAIVPELHELIREHPFDERLAGLLQELTDAQGKRRCAHSMEQGSRLRH